MSEGKERHPPLGPMSPFEDLPEDEQKDNGITVRELSEHQKELWLEQWKYDKDDYKIVEEFLNDFWFLWAQRMYIETGKPIYKQIAVSKIK